MTTLTPNLHLMNLPIPPVNLPSLLLTSIPPSPRQGLICHPTNTVEVYGPNRMLSTIFMPLPLPHESTGLAGSLNHDLPHPLTSSWISTLFGFLESMDSVAARRLALAKRAPRRRGRGAGQQEGAGQEQPAAKGKQK